MKLENEHQQTPTHPHPRSHKHTHNLEVNLFRYEQIQIPDSRGKAPVKNPTSVFLLNISVWV